MNNRNTTVWKKLIIQWVSPNCIFQLYHNHCKYFIVSFSKVQKIFRLYQHNWKTTGNSTKKCPINLTEREIERDAQSALTLWRYKSVLSREITHNVLSELLLLILTVSVEDVHELWMRSAGKLLLIERFAYKFRTTQNDSVLIMIALRNLVYWTKLFSPLCIF